MTYLSWIEWSEEWIEDVHKTETNVAVNWWHKLFQLFSQKFNADLKKQNF